MAKRTDLKKILVIGSGPIVIGQAAEFDYAGAQACRRVDEAVVELALRRPQQTVHVAAGEARPTQAHGGGEQVQVGQPGMGHSCLLQGAAPQGHVGEIHHRPVGEAQGQIQVPQANVAVQAQDLFA